MTALDPPPAGLEVEPLFQQMFELWVQPELGRRGHHMEPGDVEKVLVEMPADGPVRVFVNDEAGLVARVRTTRAIEMGESVTIDDFDEVAGIAPYEVGPDSGWICFAQIREQRVVAFDFRRNKQRACQRVDLARDYMETARHAEATGRVGPALENAYAAAELAVTAEMMLLQVPPKRHDEKRRHWSEWTKLGNAPKEHSIALADLAKRRGAARYGEGSPGVRAPFLSKLLGVVDDMILHAEKASS